MKFKSNHSCGILKIRSSFSLNEKDSLYSNMVTGVERAGQCSLSFDLIKVRSVQQMGHFKPIFIIKEMVQSAIEATCVVRELWEGLITSQWLICRDSTRWQIVVLVSTFNLTNNRIHQS